MPSKFYFSPNQLVPYMGSSVSLENVNTTNRKKGHLVVISMDSLKGNDDSSMTHSPSTYVLQATHISQNLLICRKPWTTHQPPGALSTPVLLLHPIFGQFADDCKSGKPTSEDLQFIPKLSYKMSLFYNTERERAQVFRELLTDYCGLTFIACETKDGYTTDGSLVTGNYYQTSIYTRKSKSDILLPKLSFVAINIILKANRVRVNVNRQAVSRNIKNCPSVFGEALGHAQPVQRKFTWTH